MRYFKIKYDVLLEGWRTDPNQKPLRVKGVARRWGWLGRLAVVLLGFSSFSAFATPWTNCFRVVEYSDLRHLQCTVADLECIDFCFDRWETNRWEVTNHSSGGTVQTASVLEGDWLSSARYQYTAIKGQAQPFRFAFKWDGANVGIRWVYHGWISVANIDGQLVILGCAMDQVDNDLRVGDGERPIPGGGQEDPEIPDEELTFRWDYCQDRRSVRLVNPCVPNDTAGRIVIPAAISGLPVVEIGSAAFERCINITEVVIPSTVTNIQDGAFYRCESLHTVELPDSLDAIEGHAFERCKALARVEVPIRANASLNAFPEDCEVVRTYPWDSAYKKMSQPMVTPVATEDGDWRVVDHGDSLELDWKCLSNRVAGVVAIPAAIGGKPVTAMGEDAFYSNDRITGLIIPSSVSNIGYKAIGDCRNLERLTIPVTVVNIEHGGVSHNENLGELVVEANLNEIAEDMFDGNWNLTNLVLKGEIGTIRTWAFAGFGQLEQVVIFPGVGRIEREAFVGATSLRAVVVPCTTIVEEGAFPNGCEIVRAGPQARFYDNTDAFGYEECWLPALLGTNAWNGVGTIRAMVEGGTGSGDDEDLVRICNVLGVGPARTVRQRNGTLDAYFAMPTIRMESFDVRTWTMVARVVPPEGAQIVHAPDIAPVDSDDAISIDAAYELKDFSGGRSCFYVPGKDDITVTAEDYLNDGRIVFTFDDYFVGKDYHFYRLHVRPKKWWSRR